MPTTRNQKDWIAIVAFLFSVLGWVATVSVGYFRFEGRVDSGLRRLDRMGHRLDKIDDKLGEFVSKDDLRDERNRLLNSIAAVESRCCE